MKQPSIEDYQAAIADKVCISTAELYEEFENLDQIKVDLPTGEEAYTVLPRTDQEWRLPRDDPKSPDGTGKELLMLSMRADWYERNAYMAVIPQPVVLHEQVCEVLEDYAWRLFHHYPAENTLASREYEVPMLIGRLDVIIDKSGDVQICENDDVPSLWPAMPEINPVAETYFTELERQLGLPIYTAELFQYWKRPEDRPPLPPDHYPSNYISFDRSQYWQTRRARDEAVSRYATVGPRAEENLRRFYAHNEDHWRGDINDTPLYENRRRNSRSAALSVRAYRDEPGFEKHMDKYGPRSITMGWERDCKWPLVAEKLGVLASDLAVGIEFGREWIADHPGELLVYKTLRGARTEGVAIFNGKGTRPQGVSREKDIYAKFGAAADYPVVIQPYQEADSLATAGVEFIGKGDEDDAKLEYTDRKRIREEKHISKNPGEHVVEGKENQFRMMFRVFVVYLPDEGRLALVGGLANATDGRIIHGGGHSVTLPVYRQNYLRHPNTERYRGLDEAEALARLQGGIVLGETVKTERKLLVA